MAEAVAWTKIDSWVWVWWSARWGWSQQTRLMNTIWPPTSHSSRCARQTGAPEASQCQGILRGWERGSPLGRGCRSCGAVQASHEGSLRRTWDAQGTLKRPAGWTDGKGWLPAATKQPLELLSTQQRPGPLEGSQGQCPKTAFVREVVLISHRKMLVCNVIVHLCFLLQIYFQINLSRFHMHLI